MQSASTKQEPIRVELWHEEPSIVVVQPSVTNVMTPKVSFGLQNSDLKSQSHADVLKTNEGSTRERSIVQASLQDQEDSSKDWKTIILQEKEGCKSNDSKEGNLYWQ